MRHALAVVLTILLLGCAKPERLQLLDEQRVHSSTGEQVTRTYLDRETGDKYTKTDDGPLIPIQ